MNYGQFRALLVLLVVAVAGVATWAAEEQPFSRTIKGSENPSEFPFVEAVRLYFGGVIYSYERDPRLGIRRVQLDVDRSMDDATAEEFIKYMRTAIKAYEASGREGIREICSRRHELVALPQIEKALIESDAVINAKLERDIQDARSILGDARVGMFEQYINTKAKRTMTFVQFDHTKIIESRGETPTDVLVRICERPVAATGQ